MTINLILQSATKSVNPPVKAFSLGDGYEQTHSTAIADTEIWTVSTIPLDDDDANDLEAALNALQGDTFTWIPPYGNSGDYRLNSRITRTMVGYRRSVLQFSLRKIITTFNILIPQSHIFGTYTSKGGPLNNGQFICNGGCNVTFYWRTIYPIPLFNQSVAQLVVYNGQWYILHKKSYYIVDFIYANNYLANDLGSYRGWPQGPFSPHGIGINYVPVGNVCVEDDFSSPAYGDNLVITKVIQV